MPTAIKPFLMFEGAAEEAMMLYAGLFAGAEITRLERWGADGPGKEGTINHGEMRLKDLTVRFFDSPVGHAFSFTPSVSLFVDCADEAELDRLYAGLSDGGQELMPLGEYGFSRKFGWVNDRFGVSWQLNLP